MDWYAALKSFNLVIENQSFTKAAEKRYASSSALSKHIAWLEEQLKSKLIYRSAHHFKLTTQGEALYKNSRIWVLELEKIKSEVNLKQNTLQGSLSVSLPRSFGQMMVSPFLPEFVKRYPDIQLEVLFDNRYVDLINENVDISLRVGNIIEKQLVSECIGRFEVGVFASPGYLKKYGPIKKIEDLAEHRCLVHQDFNQPHLWRFKNRTLHVKPAICTNDLAFLIESAVAGLGVVYISEFTVKQHLKDKTLVALFEKQRMPAVDYHLVYPRRSFINERVKCFIDFIKSLQF